MCQYPEYEFECKKREHKVVLPMPNELKKCRDVRKGMECKEGTKAIRYQANGDCPECEKPTYEDKIQDGQYVGKRSAAQAPRERYSRGSSTSSRYPVEGPLNQNGSSIIDSESGSVPSDYKDISQWAWTSYSSVTSEPRFNPNPPSPDRERPSSAYGGLSQLRDQSPPTKPGPPRAPLTQVQQDFADYNSFVANASGAPIIRGANPCGDPLPPDRPCPPGQQELTYEGTPLNRPPTGRTGNVSQWLSSVVPPNPAVETNRAGGRASHQSRTSRNRQSSQHHSNSSKFGERMDWQR